MLCPANMTKHNWSFSLCLIISSTRNRWIFTFSFVVITTSNWWEHSQGFILCTSTNYFAWLFLPPGVVEYSPSALLLSPLPIDENIPKASFVVPASTVLPAYFFQQESLAPALLITLAVCTYMYVCIMMKSCVIIKNVHRDDKDKTHIYVSLLVNNNSNNNEADKNIRFTCSSQNCRVFTSVSDGVKESSCDGRTGTKTLNFILGTTSDCMCTQNNINLYIICTIENNEKYQNCSPPGYKIVVDEFKKICTLFYCNFFNFL